MKKRTNLKEVFFNKMSVSGKSCLFLFKSERKCVWISVFFSVLAYYC